MSLRRCLCDDALAMMPLRRYLCDDTFATMPFDDDLATIPFWWMMFLWRCLYSDALRRCCWDYYISSFLLGIDLLFFITSKSANIIGTWNGNKETLNTYRKQCLLKHEMHMSPIMLVSNCAHGSNRDGTPSKLSSRALLNRSHQTTIKF